ncbi:MAG: hypothetical protein IKT32_04900, partial [Clostridia bacterium]|nr:hypothetical protein [Clostridia bacterium]
AYIYLANSDALEAFNLLGVYLEEKKVENNELVATGKTLDKNYAIRVTAADMANAEDGWVTVRFVITTGDNSISYRPELWNGTRAGEAKAGIVLFDDYTVTTIADIDTFRDELRLDTGVDYSAGETEKVTRIPTLIKYTNDDGEEATKFKTYEETVVYEYHATISTMFVDLTTIDAITEIDNTDADTDADDETEDTTSDSSEETSFSWALQITSIIIASVLVALLIVVLVRMIVKKYRKNKGSSTNYYNRDSREKAGLAIEAKNARKAKEAEKEELVSADEEVKSYDYDNIENNIEEEVTEETAEEATEEVSEEATESTEEVTEESVSEEEKPEDNGENN